MMIMTLYPKSYADTVSENNWQRHVLATAFKDQDNHFDNRKVRYYHS